MMERKEGDHKRGKGEEARGGETVEITASCGKPDGRRVIALKDKTRQKYREMGLCCTCGKDRFPGRLECLDCVRRRFGYRYKKMKHSKLPAERRADCPICGLRGEALVYDHNHKTNAFRDYICRSCNLGLGMFRDKIEVLKNAVAYLERHQ